MKPTEKRISLQSVAERIRLYRCGIKCHFTEEELYAFEGLVAATDMYGVISNSTEWQEIEKTDEFNKIMATIKEIRAAFGYPANKQQHKHEVRLREAAAREAQEQE